jgi:hypothetical protein
MKAMMALRTYGERAFETSHPSSMLIEHSDRFDFDQVSWIEECTHYDSRTRRSTVGIDGGLRSRVAMEVRGIREEAGEFHDVRQVGADLRQHLADVGEDLVGLGPAVVLADDLVVRCPRDLPGHGDEGTGADGL